jgi:hypothetical protein
MRSWALRRAIFPSAQTSFERCCTSKLHRPTMEIQRTSSPTPSEPENTQQQTVSHAVGQQTIAPQSGTPQVQSPQFAYFGHLPPELRIVVAGYLPTTSDLLALGASSPSGAAALEMHSVIRQASEVTTPEQFPRAKTKMQGLPEPHRTTALKCLGVRMAKLPCGQFAAILNANEQAGGVLGMAYPHLDRGVQQDVVLKVDFLDDEGRKAQVYAGLAAAARPHLDGASKTEFESAVIRIADRMVLPENRTLTLDALAQEPTTSLA